MSESVPSNTGSFDADKVDLPLHHSRLVGASDRRRKWGCRRLLLWLLGASASLLIGLAIVVIPLAVVFSDQPTEPPPEAAASPAAEQAPSRQAAATATPTMPPATPTTLPTHSVTSTSTSTVTAAAITPPVTPTTVPSPTLTPTSVPTATAPTATVSPCANGVAVPNPQENPGLVADCTVLLQVRDTLAGNAKLNWSADRAIADWEGVNIHGTPLRVTVLDLSERRLTGTIPSQLGALTSLQELWLYDNRLTGTIPPQLGGLANLQALGLSENQLSGTIPPQLSALSHLEHLWLDTNQLSGAIPVELGHLVNLRTLTLNMNQLSGAIPPQIGSLVNLRFLSLDDNSPDAYRTDCAESLRTILKSPDSRSVATLQQWSRQVRRRQPPRLPSSRHLPSPAQ